MMEAQKEAEEIGGLSEQVLVSKEAPERVRLTRFAAHARSCGVGKHCTEHGNARRPVFECCRCGAQFERVDEKEEVKN